MQLYHLPTSCVTLDKLLHLFTLHLVKNLLGNFNNDLIEVELLEQCLVHSRPSIKLSILLNNEVFGIGSSTTFWEYWKAGTWTNMISVSTEHVIWNRVEQLDLICFKFLQLQKKNDNFCVILRGRTMSQNLIPSAELSNKRSYR